MSYPLWFGGDGAVGDVVATSAPLLARGRSGSPPGSSPGPRALPSPDETIVARVRGGEVDAFEQLFRELHPPLVRFAASHGVDADEADGIVVDVFVAVWESRSTWAPATSVASYFFRAVRNRALNAVRDAHTAARYRTSAARELGAPLMGEAPEAADYAIEAVERSVSLWEAIASLPQRHRVLLTLRWRDGLSLDEIAAVLGTSVGATKTGLTRAARALRTVLPDDFR